MGDAQKSELMLEDLLIFEQSGQKYAVRSAVVREVLRAFSAVTLPKAPPLVEGILNVRGEIIPLLNMRRRLASSQSCSSSSRSGAEPGASAGEENQ